MLLTGLLFAFLGIARVYGNPIGKVVIESIRVLLASLAKTFRMTTLVSSHSWGCIWALTNSRRSCRMPTWNCFGSIPTWSSQCGWSTILGVNALKRILRLMMELRTSVNDLLSLKKEVVSLTPILSLAFPSWVLGPLLSRWRICGICKRLVVVSRVLYL